jgi:hypothetical protein
MSKGKYGYGHSPYFQLKLFLQRIRERFYLLDSEAVAKEGG